MNALAETTDCPIDVVIPTRNRPAKLERCLRALAEARRTLPFRAFAVDSSTTAEMRKAVDEVCGKFPFVSVHRHQRTGFAAARNECTLAGNAPLIVSVDDDVYVAPNAIDRLVDRYASGDGWRIVAGRVFWGEAGSTPVRLRKNGYGVAEIDDSRTDFYVTALILYPRDLASQCPFEEQASWAEDRFIGALWRSKRVQLLWEPTAEARHDEEHNTEAARSQESHIYANLFDAAFVRRSISWAVSFEFLGFAAGAKLYFRRPGPAAEYCLAWLRGNLLFARNWRRLRKVANARLMGAPPDILLPTRVHTP